jgi:phage baseplate assembly protein V
MAHRSTPLIMHTSRCFAALCALRTMDKPDHSGLIGDLLRLGVIETVDLTTARVTVRCGEVLSPPLPWYELAGTVSTWFPPAVGEQVMVDCPEGDIAGAVVKRGINCDAFPAAGNDATIRVKLPGGSEITFDPEANELVINLTGKIRLIAPDGFDIEADVKVTGKIEATDDITTPADVKAGDISLKTHKHKDVSAGMANSGVPVP